MNTEKVRRELAEESWGLRAWLALFRDLYFQFDRRTLGFSRILLGFLLLTDVLHRGRAWLDMYSSIGVLPTVTNLQRPQMSGVFTLFNAFVTPPELGALWVFMAVNAVCVMVGFHTRVAQVLALFLHAGMNSRVLLAENGGYVVNNLLLLWTVFLPMGERFSLDALLASLRRTHERTAADLNDRSTSLAPGIDAPYTTLLGFVLTIQIAAIYYFNAIHKTGPAWRNGTAVHFVLYVDRMATPIVSLLRDHIPDGLILFMTRATMAFEAAIPVVLLQPLARPWARRAVIFMMCTLHLAFGTTFVLGPFAWSLCVFATLFFSREDWEIASRTMRRASRARVVVFDPRSAGALAVCRLLKRLDRFELLRFEEREEGEPLPLGLAVRGASRATLVADLVAALPLGPIVAWILRLPLVTNLTAALLGAIERRDVSGFLGLRLPSRAPVEVSEPPPAPRLSAAIVLLPVVAVALAVAVAIKRGEAPSGVALVVAVTAISAVVAAWFAFPVLTFARARKVAIGALRELLILAMFAGAVEQGLVENWAVNRRLKVPQPEVLGVLAHKLRFYQGWFMFSPNPVTEDGTIVVDAITVDGRHIDPFTGKRPLWQLNESLGLSQLWSDYFNRIQLPANASMRDAMKDYMLRYPERTGHAEDALVSGDVYWVKKSSPRWPEHKLRPAERSLLFSFKDGVITP